MCGLQCKWNRSDGVWVSNEYQKAFRTLSHITNTLSVVAMISILFSWPCDRLRDWPSPWLTVFVTDRLRDWPSPWLTVSVTGRLCDWPSPWLAVSVTDRLRDWPSPWLTVSVTDRLFWTCTCFTEESKSRTREWSSDAAIQGWSKLGLVQVKVIVFVRSLNLPCSFRECWLWDGEMIFMGLQWKNR